MPGTPPYDEEEVVRLALKSLKKEHPEWAIWQEPELKERMGEAPPAHREKTAREENEEFFNDPEEWKRQIPKRF